LTSSSSTAAGSDLLSKVPAATLAFWVAKICATTVGETGGDALSMTLNLGYAVSSLIFLAFFLVAVAAQIVARRYHPTIYWLVVVATTTVGTTTSDYMDRTLGLGYVKSSAALLCAVIAILVAWRLTTGRIAVDKVIARRDEAFYWVTILVSNTLGTALGDFTASSAGLGFENGALIFAGLIAVVGALHLFTKAPGAILFWAAYILTRPLGATLGDTLTKPHADGGQALGRFAATFTIAAAMTVVVVWTSRRRGADPTGINGVRS